MPSFSAFSHSRNDLNFTLKHWPSLRFQIEFTPTLLAADWQDIGVSFTADSDGQTDLTQALPSLSPASFFRAHEVP